MSGSEAEVDARCRSYARLRILHVVAAYYPAVRYGGPIRSVHGLAAALARRGHDVHVYTTNIDGDVDLDVPLGQPVDLDGVHVHYFRVPALRRLVWSPELGRRLDRDLRFFDVAHLHAVYSWPLLKAARAADRSGVPYVIAPRGMLIRDMVRAKSRFFKTAWINLVERRSLARASAVHVTADMERIELQALGLPVPNPIDIPNGIEIPTQYPPLTAGPFASLPARYVLFLSRISWKKGLDRLIRAWQHVADIPLVIAGNDDEDFRPRLEALAREAGVAERIIFIGGVSDAQKWALYAGAQLFVLPSYSENFGNVVTEAMAMRCPVILTREVGIAPLVESSGAGRVVGGSPEELARVVNELLGDPSLRERMGSRGADVVRQRLSWNALALRAESLYMGILGRKNSLAIDAIV